MPNGFLVRWSFFIRPLKLASRKLLPSQFFPSFHDSNPFVYSNHGTDLEVEEYLSSESGLPGIGDPQRWLDEKMNRRRYISYFFSFQIWTNIFKIPMTLQGLNVLTPIFDCQHASPSCQRCQHPLSIVLSYHHTSKPYHMFPTHFASVFSDLAISLIFLTPPTHFPTIFLRVFACFHASYE